jgi:hypothetical protein
MKRSRTCFGSFVKREPCASELLDQLVLVRLDVLRHVGLRRVDQVGEAQLVEPHVAQRQLVLRPSYSARSSASETVTVLASRSRTVRASSSWRWYSRYFGSVTMNRGSQWRA